MPLQNCNIGPVMFSNSYHITRPLVVQAGGYIEGYLVRSHYSKRKENKLYIESIQHQHHTPANLIQIKYQFDENAIPESRVLACDKHWQTLA